MLDSVMMFLVVRARLMRVPFLLCTVVGSECDV